MKIQFGKKHFVLFAFLLVLLVPAFFLFMQSKSYSELLQLERHIWEQAAVLLFTILSFLIIFAFKNRVLSLIAVSCLCVLCIILEPVFCFSILPMILSVWCVMKIKKEENTLFFISLSIFSLLALSSGIVALVSGVYDFIRYYYLNHKVFIIIYAVLFTVATACIALLSKKKNDSAKESALSASKREEVRSAKWTVLVFYFILFVIVNAVAMMINGINYFYIFNYTLVLYVAYTVTLVANRKKLF